MNVGSLPKEFPPSNIDSKRKDLTHISAWADREEFRNVFNLIFQSAKDAYGSKTSALQTLKVWKIRLGKQTPVSVLCTITILEAQLYDEKCQQDGSSDKANEIKSMYSGAFTRFINHLTESYMQSGAGRKGSMADRVKEIGIEGFLVELRHLCAHSSLSIAVDVFRRSADYCMNWLKHSYWTRELDHIQSCERRQIKGEGLKKNFVDDLEYIAQVYDLATMAIHKGVKTLSGTEKVLTPAQFRMLQEHARANKVDQLNSVVFDVIRYVFETMKLPRHPETVPTVCDVFQRCCKYMYDAPVNGNTQGLASVHQQLFQMLVVKGYIQTYLEKLLQICEDGQQTVERRLGAKFWATEIALAFRLLKKFKKLLKDVPGRSFQFNHREHTKKMNKSVRAIYQNKLRVDLQNTIILGMSVNCPWHLRLSRSYLIDRILNVNEYTKEILPIILALSEPHLKLSQRETIEAATEKYTMNYLAAIDDGDIQTETVAASTPKRPSASQRRQDHGKLYTMDDVRERLSASGRENGTATDVKKPKLAGVWSEVANEDLDWGKCPLGKLIWE